jgi:hypothetical protein
MNDATGRQFAADGAWRGAALALVGELEARGLVAQLHRHGTVRVRNPAGEPDKDDPRGQLMSPGLRQEVACRRHDADGALWWFWCWSGPTRKSAPELEPLCPAWDAAMAAEQIAKVLAVPFADSPEGVSDERS